MFLIFAVLKRIFLSLLPPQIPHSLLVMPWIAPKTPLPRYETVPNPTKVDFIITSELLVESLGTWECWHCFITLTTSNKYLISCARSVPEAQERWGDSSSLIPTFSGLTSAFHFNIHTHTITVTFPILKLQCYYIRAVSSNEVVSFEQAKIKLIWKTTIQSWNSALCTCYKHKNSVSMDILLTSLIIKIRK